jgi:hypothetical protein
VAHEEVDANRQLDLWERSLEQQVGAAALDADLAQPTRAKAARPLEKPDDFRPPLVQRQHTADRVDGRFDRGGLVQVGGGTRAPRSPQVEHR